jgi:hypothetical protein
MKLCAASAVVISILVCGSQSLWGQTLQQYDSTFAERLLVQQQLEEPVLQHSDYVTFGFGYSRSHYLRNFLGAIFVASYNHAFSQVVEIDASVYYAERFMQDYSSFLTSLTSDIGIITQISPTLPLRFGIGAAFRWSASLQKSGGFNLPRIYYLETLQLGVNAKVEYLFPISNSIDIGLRGQVQSFFTPFSTVSNTTATLPTYVYGDPLIKVINLGVFLRIGF